MTDEHDGWDPLASLAQLGDPNRRRLYGLVAASEGPVGRDDAATALGMSRELAAFHLDRLVSAGLLAAEYRRRGDRRGPGAGRPAKLYRRAEREVQVSLPPRAYERLAGRLVEAVRRSQGSGGVEALHEVARAQGSTDGAQARRDAGPRPGRRRSREALVELLRGAGYEPRVAADSGDVQLGNCPYRALSESHRELTCGMNLSWAQGVLDALADPGLEAELTPAPGRCCVVFREVSRPAPAG